MAQPLKLEDLGIDGHRRTVDVTATERLILPFTRGESTSLVVGPGGAVAADTTPEAKEAAERGDADFFSRIGRNFRSFAKCRR